jgi:hypothetical protein
MIKKIFMGVLIAGVFGLLVLGAVNRTIAKSAEREPFALSENKTAKISGGNGNQGQKQAPDNDPEDCLPKYRADEPRSGGGLGQGSEGFDPAEEGRGYNGENHTNLGGQPEGAPEDGLGTGLAEVEAWLTYSGTVQSTSEDLWVVNLIEIGPLEITGRLLSYLQEKGFVVTTGDELLVIGFMEGDDFEVGGVENVSTGEQIAVREETGHPLWAGGRWGGGKQ